MSQNLYYNTTFSKERQIILFFFFFEIPALLSCKRGNPEHEKSN